ncbi:YjdJ family protein [Heyndrickxia sp. NPDC080065]|uniref:YjdJ family protein n=1 Tax=Heyndrickxia sp. NPDC080065 TaxID=3390568 RepID=UPI003CFC159A
MAITGLLFSTAVAWYEGSALIDYPSEWTYSTPFSQLLNGQILSESDISQLDFFVYAAKFQPTFPLIMQITGLYLLVLIGYSFLKNQNKWFAYYLFFLGGSLFLLSYLASNSPTVGGRIFFTSSLVIGLLCILLAVITYFQLFYHNRNEMTN